MAYKPLYDEAYLKALISQVRKFNKKKNVQRRSEQVASQVPTFNFTDSQKAAALILKNIKSKKKGEKNARD